MTLPGGSTALKAVAQPPVRIPAAAAMRRCIHSPSPAQSTSRALAQVYDSLGDRGRRRAFHHVLRAAVDWRGQVITMLDRAYLAESMPSLIVWGEQDTVIPVKHAYAAHAVLPGSQLEIIPHAGHFPHEDDPEHFSAALIDFILDTKPATYDGRGWVKSPLPMVPVRASSGRRRPEAQEQ